jgi:hypothetical protein
MYVILYFELPISLKESLMRVAKQAIALAAFGLSMFLLAACGPSNSPAATPTAQAQATAVLAANPTPSPAPSVAPTSAPSPTKAPSATATPSAKDMLSAALASAVSKLKTYRVIEVQDGRKIEVIMPDRFMAWEPYPPIVKIGGTIWMYRNGMVVTYNQLSVPYFDIADIAWIKQEMSKAPQVVLLGPTAVDISPVAKDKVPSVGYSASILFVRVSPPKTPGGTPVATKLDQPVKIYFSASDGFPVRVELGAPNPQTIIFYDHNQKIDPIEPLQ